MTLLSILINWVHLVGAAIWIGGMIFINLIFYKVLEVLEPQHRGKTMEAMTSNYAKVVNLAIALMVLT